VSPTAGRRGHAASPRGRDYVRWAHVTFGEISVDWLIHGRADTDGDANNNAVVKH